MRLWTTEELKSLVNYILCQGYTTEWPTTDKDCALWENAADFVETTTGSIRRSGNT